MARRFRFRLETVRKLRRQAQDVQRRAVADVVRTVGLVEERIAGLTRQLHGTTDQSRNAQQARRLDMASLRGHQFYRSWLHRQITEADAELTRRKAQLEAERARLAEASKRLKVIEKLRERQWTRYRTGVAREEQAAADEAALTMHMRQRGPMRRELGA